LTSIFFKGVGSTTSRKSGFRYSQWAKLGRLALPGDCDFLFHSHGVSPDFGALDCPKKFPRGVFGDVLGYDSDRPKLPPHEVFGFLGSQTKNGKQTHLDKLIFSVILDAWINAGFLLEKKTRSFQGPHK